MKEINRQFYPILEFFNNNNPPPPYLKQVTSPFDNLANDLVSQYGEAVGKPSPEISAALRKLLEAKDCAVRAFLSDHTK